MNIVLSASSLRSPQAAVFRGAGAAASQAISARVFAAVRSSAPSYCPSRMNGVIPCVFSNRQVRCFARQRTAAHPIVLQRAEGDASSSSSTDHPGFKLNTSGEPDLYSPVDREASLKSFPKTIPGPPSGFQWWWLPTMRTAVLVPEGWHTYSGWGDLLVCPIEKHIITPANTPTTTGVSMWVSQITRALGGRLFNDDTPHSIAQWMVSHLMRRAAQWRDDAARAAGVDVRTRHAVDAHTQSLQQRAEAVIGAAEAIAGSQNKMK